MVLGHIDRVPCNIDERGMAHEVHHPVVLAVAIPYPTEGTASIHLVGAEYIKQ